MKTYLKVRVGVLTRWVAGGRVGRRHCEGLEEWGRVKEEGMGEKQE
jgi:hypothetical protein